jgi:MYXO-CTERM domain-containing protein
VIGARPTGVAAALALALGTAHVAHSNGRYPTSMSVAFRPGDRDAIYLATTFGLLIGGADGRFRWVCEANLGYEGRFDPKYRIAADGTIYLSTYKGLRLSKDGGCTFTTATAELPAADPSYLANRWIEAVDVAANGDVWIATADAGQENEVWRSTDGAARFTPTGNRSSQIWWKSLVVAPSDPTRVYVTGYQVSQQLDDAGLVPASVHLRVTRDAGGSWDQLPLTGVTLGASPLVFVDAVAPDDPDLVFLHSDRAGSPSRDRLYRSADGGLTFTEVLATTDAIRAVVIRGAEVLVATKEDGLYRSSDRGQTFAPVANSPQANCLGDRGDALFACGANWEPDLFALGRSSDAAGWTKVFRFSEMVGPLACPVGTVQHDRCEVQEWPMVREQFGIPAPIDAGIDPPKPAPAGCCQSGGGSGPLGLGLAAFTFAWLRRRRSR